MFQIYFVHLTLIVIYYAREKMVSEPFQPKHTKASKCAANLSSLLKSQNCEEGVFQDNRKCN